MKNRFTLRLILGLFLVAGVATQAADAKFKPLFNGKNLKGWEPTPGGKWEVKNGVIVGTSPKANAVTASCSPRNDLRTSW